MSLRQDLEARLTGLPGLTRRPSRHGDSQSYFVADREVAHFHGDGRMDVRLTRERIRQMKAARELDARVVTRGPSADWAAIPIESPSDVALALQLVDEAVRANS